jgi:uncharacterized membrane protein YfcA
MEWLICMAVGAVSGFLAGLLGIGGGAIIVPALLYALPLMGVGGPELMKIAVATSLAIVAPTAIASAQAHAARGAVSWEAFARMTPGVVVGATAGALLAAQVDPRIISLVFIAFALHNATRMILGARRSATGVAPLPGVAALSAKGFGVGALSSLLGVAGGALVAPMLSRHVALPRAIGTAAVVGLPLAAASAFAYALADPPGGCPQGCAGYVFLPAVGAVGVAAVLTAPWGTRAAHVLPVAALKRVFGCVLLLVAGNLIHKSLPDSGAIGAEARRVVAAALERSNADAPVAAQAPGWLGSSAIASTPGKR